MLWVFNDIKSVNRTTRYLAEMFPQGAQRWKRTCGDTHMTLKEASVCLTVKTVRRVGCWWIRTLKRFLAGCNFPQDDSKTERHFQLVTVWFNNEERCDTCRLVRAGEDPQLHYWWLCICSSPTCISRTLCCRLGWCYRASEEKSNTGTHLFRPSSWTFSAKTQFSPAQNLPAGTTTTMSLLFCSHQSTGWKNPSMHAPHYLHSVAFSYQELAAVEASVDFKFFFGLVQPETQSLISYTQ